MCIRDSTCDEATLGDGDWTNGVVQYDNNCSGVADENPDETWYIDEDGDGFEAPQGTLDCLSPGAAYTRTPNNPTDCVDQNPFINPDALEVFADQVDQDCDGFELCFTDADGDGYGEGFSATMPSLLVFDPNGFHSEMYAAGLRAGLSPITVASTPAELAAAGPHDMLAVNIDLGTPQNLSLIHI